MGGYDVLSRPELSGLTQAARPSREMIEQLARDDAAESGSFFARRLSPQGVSRSCETKNAYGRKNARRVARVLRGKQGDDVRAYHCGNCSRYHVGHPPAVRFS